MAYLGNEPVNTVGDISTNIHNGDGTTTAFALPTEVVNDLSVIVTVDGVKQHTDTYSVSGTTLTFSEAPDTGTNNIELIVLGTVQDIGAPASSSVGINHLSASGTASSSTFLRGDNTWTEVNTDLVNDTTPQLGGNLDLNGNTIEGVSATELGYLDGVTSDIQTQIDNIDTDLVNDTTPQLGGNLDANGNNITGIVTAKSANYTAVDGDSLIITAGGITITLPATPSAGDTVVVKDGTGDAANTNWTVARNGSNIASSATDLTFDKNWAEITMTYVDATVGWSV